MVKGKINSFQSLGTVDGEGVRFVVFTQGCPLRCGCCHNPDTWDISGGSEYTPKQVAERVVKYKQYFGEKGGITVSGGEPLIQPDFVKEVFSLCKKNKINTCLDTSGVVLTDKVKAVLKLTDRVLLDIKYTDDTRYKEFVGCGLNKPLEFLRYLNQTGVKTTVRYVVIPTVNDAKEDILKLKEICKSYKVVDKIELLPFRKICKVKYDNLGIPFPFEKYAEPTATQMQTLNDLINE